MTHKIKRLGERAPRHHQKALRTKEPEGIWLSIRSNEMMRDTMNELISEIKEHGIEYESYGSQKRVYLHLKNVPDTFKKSLNSWIYYQPVSQLNNPPDISDYERIEW